MIRPATLHDVKALVDIENKCFETDRLSRRNFRYIITEGNAETIVFEKDERVCGYSMVLFNSGTSLARLYSIAVDPGFQGHGIGAKLLKASEDVALENDCITMRLEIRKDNPTAQKLYINAGYKEFGVYMDYYDDHMDALRYEKRLGPQSKPAGLKVPYYPQTLEFTCGPSALLMAMRTLDSKVQFNRKNELRLWRESTTIFMTAGHGGCDPYGMALAAQRRGFDIDLFVNEKGPLFIDSVRSPEKKEVMRIVQEDFVDQIKKKPEIKLQYRSISVEKLQDYFEQGGIPIVLISSYRIYHEKFPHWVVVTGFDDRFIYVHDPYVDDENDKVPMDCINMPILQKDFARMARYGKAGLKAVLILKKAAAPKQ